MQLVYLYYVKHALQIDNTLLVEECLKGDKEAMRLFYEGFAPRMFALVFRYVHNRADAEDVLHYGFILAFSRLSSLRNPDQVEYWLATIMKNLSLQFLKNQDVATIIRDIPEVEDTPEMDDIIDVEVIESLIRKLPPGYQKVFRLAVLENKSHKEIAAILGIAPNSSSSQLFHAKMMMRRLIADYRKQAGMLSVLLIAVACGIWLLTDNGDNHGDKGGTATDTLTAAIPSAGTSESSESSGSLATGSPCNSQPVAVAPTVGGRMPSVVLLPDSGRTETDNAVETEIKEIQPAIAGNTQPNDTVAQDTPVLPDVVQSPDDYSGYYAANYPVSNMQGGNGWSVNLSGNMPVSNNGIDRSGSGIFDPGDNNEPMEPVDFEDYRKMSHVNHAPITFSLTARKSLSQRLGIETGLSYTLLRTTYSQSGVKTRCRWHYIGVPLRLNTRIFSTSRYSTYFTVGGELHIPLYSKSYPVKNADPYIIRTGRFSTPVSWSANASLGFSLSLSPDVDLFIEPTVMYHFGSSYKVPNIWTDNKWTFSLPLGLRFNW